MKFVFLLDTIITDIDYEVLKKLLKNSLSRNKPII